MAGVKGGTSYSGDLNLLDALIVSAVFDSNSPSAGTAIGVSAFTQISNTLPVAVFALGGITQSTAPELIRSGAAGIAGVSGLFEA